MATIHDRNSAFPILTYPLNTNLNTSATLLNVKEDIATYWGGADKEKYFVITASELFEKIDESRVNRAALKIKNINAVNKRTVDANWIAYTGDDNLQNPDHYYVYDFEPNVVRAKFINNTYNGIAGRIAITQDGNIYVIFHYTQIIPIDGGTVGGDNASAGALIPPHP